MLLHQARSGGQVAAIGQLLHNSRHASNTSVSEQYCDFRVLQLAGSGGKISSQVVVVVDDVDELDVQTPHSVGQLAASVALSRGSSHISIDTLSHRGSSLQDVGGDVAVAVVTVLHSSMKPAVLADGVVVLPKNMALKQVNY